MLNTTNAVLDRVAARRAIHSDYAISKALGCHRAVVSNYRRDKNQMDESVAVRAAEIAQLPPVVVLARLQLERCKTPEARTHWETLAKLAEREFGAM